MPSLSAFKKGFDVNKGAVVGQFVVSIVTCGHVVKVPFEQYEFPLSLTLEHISDQNLEKKDKIGDSKEQSLRKEGNLCLKAFKSHVNANEKTGRIIYSQYGSPYECHFGSPKLVNASDNEFIITCCGYGIRRRDIPTLKQLKEKEGVNAQAEKLLHSIDPETLGSYRILNSRFNSSKCAKCGKGIGFGDRIGKRESGASNKGGWSHLECILAQSKSTKRKHSTASTDDTPGSSVITRSKSRRIKPSLKSF